MYIYSKHETQMGLQRYTLVVSTLEFTCIMTYTPERVVFY